MQHWNVGRKQKNFYKCLLLLHPLEFFLIYKQKHSNFIVYGHVIICRVYEPFYFFLFLIIEAYVQKNLEDH